jgi:asparagine N-glycosylation enzyme membrane subunit Stt3
VRSALGLLLGLALVAALSFASRWVLHARTPDPARESWVVSDPDGLYHARRVERAIEEGMPVAERDPFLNFPGGAAIPWPPYYDAFLATALQPLLPEEPEARHGFIERAVGSAPLLFGVLTTLLAFLAGRALAGNGAGAVAGIWYALSTASIVYSHSGNGDHHAFVSMIVGAMWLLLAVMFGKGQDGAPRLESPTRAWGSGAAAGALAGIAIGAWVASLLHVILIEIVFAWLLFRYRRGRRRGLPAFGLAFHLAAIGFLFPALWQSPWKEEFPWMVVNLSWFHLLFLTLGAAVFLPLFFLRDDSSTRRRYPWIVGALLAGIALVSWILDAGPMPGIAEGFAWVSRADLFMSDVAESHPLLGAGSNPAELFAYLGWGIPLLPILWIGALVVFWRRGDEVLLPWLVAVPFLALQAARQARFAEALALPAAVLFGWGVVTVVRMLPKRLPPWPILLVVALLLQGGTVGRISAEVFGESPRRPLERRNLAARELIRWIGENSKLGDWSVLANWSRGHEIEWAAQRPTVATNFGSYVGEEGFRAPAHFFLAEDPARAEETMASRGARYALISSLFTNALPGLVRSEGEEAEGRFFTLGEQGAGVIQPAWFHTVGARLLFGGRPHPRAGRPEEPSLDFLRLVHVSPVILKRSPLSRWSPWTPYGWIWERVAGTRLEVKSTPGTLCTVEIEVHYPPAEDERAQVIRFLNHTHADADGIARLRVPYATSSANGDGVVRSARWKCGTQEGELRIDEADVLEGRTLLLP